MKPFLAGLFILFVLSGCVIPLRPLQTPTPTAQPLPSTPSAVPEQLSTPGIAPYGSVKLLNGEPLAGVTICRGFASYDGVAIGTTDEQGLFEGEFTFIPGDEMVRVWPVMQGYTFEPKEYYWRHYYGYEPHELTFLAHRALPLLLTPETCTD